MKSRNELRTYHQQWRDKNKDRNNKRMREKMHSLKLELIEEYGGNCQCCGETHHAFLTVDHINKDGKAHRAKLNNKGGYYLYFDIKKQGFPKDKYRVLCMNCNFALRYEEVCPHKKIERERSPANYEEVKE